jgi:hypothetical protein
MEHCVCGNSLRPTEVKITVSPCKCRKPGPGRRTVLREFVLDENRVTPTQYAERKRLGLPVITEIEKSVCRENQR